MNIDSPQAAPTGAIILVVDDHEPARRFAVRVLRAAGHTVLEAPGASAALELMSERGPSVDVLITDIVMPEILGYELAERVWTARPGLPVLFVSGSAESSWGDESTAVGATDFLLKPFDQEQLAEAVARLLLAAVPHAPVDARPSTDGLAATRSRLARGLSAVRRSLPTGRTLPAVEWERRHRWLVMILWAHAVTLSIVGALFCGCGPTGILHGAVLAPFALLATSGHFRRRTRQLIATGGLLTASAVIVDLSHGMTEAHFHYFVMVALLSLYESWVPFFVAIAYVMFQHGVMSTMTPSEVFDHEGSPWLWAGVHAVAIAFLAIVNVLNWRVNEDARRAEARIRSRLAHRALHDELSGLPNRRLLVEELEKAFAVCGDSDCSAAVIFVDLDNFKLVNDSYGHDAGDRLLVDVAARLRGAVRDTDLVARTGGDEFVIFARPVAGDDEALAVAARAHDAIQAPLDIAGSQRQMTVSVGVSCLSCEDAAITEAMARADAALYRAKADGRGRVQLADANVLSEARRRMDVERALEECAPGDFDLHYQPIVDLTDGAIVAVEALLRWTHPQMGRMAPDEFIPIAESSGRIIDIGRWVLDRACRDAVRWDALRGRPTRVFVNISACQLTDPEFADTVMDALASSGACGSHLALEVTETAAIEGGVPASTLAALQAAGVDLALDDFGTGFSSLSHLARFPISILKLDRMFLDTASHDPDGVAILDTVVHLARGLKVTSLAEGVETELQLAEIRARGFQLAQGYFFSRPQPSTELDAILQLDRPYRALMTGSEPAARLVP